MESKALWVVEEGKLEIRSYTLCELRPDEVLVRNKACGVCCWDSYLVRGISATGPMPYMFGHEGVGIIEKVGSEVTDFKPGDKVFCCGNDRGMFSEFFNVPTKNIAKIPDDVTDYAKWVCEPTRCVVNLLQKTEIEAGDHVVLVGAGYMGMLTLMGLVNGSQAGKITVFETREDRIALASKYHPTEIYQPYSEAGAARIKEIQNAGGADIVIEFSASADGFKLANELTSRPGGKNLGGKLIVGSWHRQDLTFDPTLWHMSGLTVMNCSPMCNRHYPNMVKRTGELVAKGIYTPGDLVTHVADYRDCWDVFARSIDKKDGYIKGAITF